MYAHEALAVFSLVRRGTCQQLTNGRRSPVLALHVDRVYRRVPRFLPLSIDRSTIVPFYRRGKTKNKTRRASFVEERSGSIIRVYYIRYSLTFSRQFNQLHRGIVRSFRNGTGWFFLSTKTSAFSLVRPSLSLSHASLLSSGFANVGFFSRDTRSLSLSFISPDHASPCASPPRVLSSPLSTSRLEDLE